MKNIDYIRKYELFTNAEILHRPIDKPENFRNFIRDIYFDYKSLLEYESFKGEITIKTYDLVYSQIRQKLNSLGNKTPWDLPKDAYVRIDDFYMQLMPEFCPVLHKQIDKLSRMAARSLKEFMSEHGLRSFSYKNLSDQELSKVSRVTQIAYKFYLEKDEQEREERTRRDAEERRIHRERMENDPQYRAKHMYDSFGSVYSFGSVFGGFFNNRFFQDMFIAMLKDSTVPTNELRTLGLNECCTMDEVKSTYRNLAMVHHPDKGGSKEKFVEITEAKDKVLNYLNSK